MLAWRRLRTYGVLRKAGGGWRRGGFDSIGWRGGVNVMVDWRLMCCHGGEHAKSRLRGNRDRGWPMTGGGGTG